MNMTAFEGLMSKFDPARKAHEIIAFLQYQHTASLNGRKFVLGLSGGIDSAIVAALVVQAEIPLHVIMLPDSQTFPEHSSSVKTARLMINFLGISDHCVTLFSIRPLINQRCNICKPMKAAGCQEVLCRGNRAARQRMIELYDMARRVNGIVCGTENRTEHMLGYATLHGDAASDIEPILGLLKTEVRLLARYLKLPDEIIDQAPSANLWPGQTDEGELGFTYPEADTVLLHLERDIDIRDFELPDAVVKKVCSRIKATEFKRRDKPVLI